MVARRNILEFAQTMPPRGGLGPLKRLLGRKTQRKVSKFPRGHSYWPLGKKTQRIERERCHRLIAHNGEQNAVSFYEVCVYEF